MRYQIRLFKLVGVVGSIAQEDVVVRYTFESEARNDFQIAHPDFAPLGHYR